MRAFEIPRCTYWWMTEATGNAVSLILTAEVDRYSTSAIILMSYMSLL